MKIFRGKLLPRTISFVMVLILCFGMFPMKTFAAAYDPNNQYQEVGLRFWENKEPGIRFYINAANRYILETVTEPNVGSTFGEWSVMDLLRGMYTQGDYLNHIPDNYFEDYLGRVESYVTMLDGELDRSKSTEWSRLMLALTPLSYDITNVSGQYDFIGKLSKSYRFSLRQGLNGPVWEIIAMNTGAYEFYKDENNRDVNTFGKMIDFILGKEITQEDGTVGGWALMGKTPDTDITGMTLQALAPYYVDEERYNDAGATTSYNDFCCAVERGVLTLANIQKENGGYGGWGSINSESIVQVIVALTELDIDPVSDNVRLPYIGKTCSFKKGGEERDGVWTDNMIDALLTFWAWGSGSSPEVSGFKHVTAGDDGGGGSGHSVNAMATDQAVYGLIAYDRWLNGENDLYDMTDMMNDEYKTFQVASYALSYDLNNGTEPRISSYAPYAAVELPEGSDIEGRTFTGWNSKADGTGSSYQPGELLVMPEEDITLYAQYDSIEYTITLNTNGGTIEGMQIPETYTILNDAILLPDADHILKEDLTFEGWYTNQEFSGEPVTEIAAGSTGNRVFFAKWVKHDPPTIDTSLTDDEITTTASQLIMDVWARDENDIKIDASKVVVMLNDQQVQFTEDGTEKITYILDLVLGENSLTVTATDGIDKETSITYTIIREKTVEVNDVISLINNLPDDITLDDKADVEAARNAFNLLTEEQKKFVDNRERLLSAENTIDRLLAKQVEDKITELPQDLTLDNKEAVEAARSAYLELTEKQRDLVSNLEKLEQAESTIASLLDDQRAAQEVIDKINNLPEDITLEHKTDVEAARADYEALSDDQEKLVSNINKLIKAEQKITQLEKDLSDAQNIVSMIDELPEIVTLSDKKDIDAAYNAYESLNDDAKDYVGNKDKLMNARDTIDKLENQVKQVVDSIKSLPDTISLDHKDMVNNIKSAYEALSAEQRSLVTNSDKLEKALERINELENESPKSILDLVKEGQKTITVEATTVLSKDVFKELKNSGKETTFEMKSNDGSTLYSWTFEGNEIQNVDQNINLGLSFVTDNKDVIDKLVGNEDSLYLSFAHHGDLPGPANMKVYVGNKYKDGDKVNLYYYNEQTGKAEETAKDLVVKNGYVDFTITHCSDYFLTENIIKSEDVIDDNNYQSGESSSNNIKNSNNKSSSVKTGDESNTLLYVFILLTTATCFIVVLRKKNVFNR